MNRHEIDNTNKQTMITLIEMQQIYLNRNLKNYITQYLNANFNILKLVLTLQTYIILIQMEWIANYLKEQALIAASSLLSSLSSTPFLLLNHILQASFFSTALTSFIAFVFTILNFAYAESISRFKIIQIIAICIFYALKIWQAYNWLLSLFTIVSSAIVSMYIYDCSESIATKINTNNHGVRRDITLITIVVAAILSSLWLISLVKQSNPKYENYGYFAILAIVVFVALLVRTRNVGKSMFHLMIMSLIVILRIWISNLVQDHPIASAELPLSSIPFLLMALDAEKKERDKTRNNFYKNLFFSSIAFLIYSLLNWPDFPLELMYGAIILVFTVLGK